MSTFSHTALDVIETEVQAINQLQARIDTTFDQACELILACQGRVIVTGMGKSGHIANKIAATLASTGTPAFFVHPAEASHGDMGMITSKDVVLALSNSGTTAELVTLLPLIKRLATPLITMTGASDSTLAQAATVNLDVKVSKEACPLDLAPTASTTVALVMGDALAMACLQARGFSADDFALSHPGGALGRRLLLRVGDLMHNGDAIPMVRTGASVADAIVEMSAKKLGMTCVCDAQMRLLGVFTDGDLRRVICEHQQWQSMAIVDVMSASAKTATRDDLAAAALQLMEAHKISALVITDAQATVTGILHMHDLLRAGVI